MTRINTKKPMNLPQLTPREYFPPDKIKFIVYSITMLKLPVLFCLLLTVPQIWAQEGVSSLASKTPLGDAVIKTTATVLTPFAAAAPVTLPPALPVDARTPAAAHAEDVSKSDGPGPEPEDEELPELDIEVFLRSRISKIAQQYLGVSYKYAGVSPSGFDCSGLVYFVFLEAAGMEVSRSTVGLWKTGKPVKLAEARQGDLLIFTTVRPGSSHVGIVLENSPEEGIRFIHAASGGSKRGVIISGLNEAYYKARVMGARTFF
jgi:hypothetical protein